MKFLFFAFDAASFEAIIDLDKQTRRTGHTSETLVYNHSKNYARSMQGRYEELGIANFTSRAAMPVGIRGFFANKRACKNARVLDKSLVACLYALLRAVQFFTSSLKRRGGGVFGRNGLHILSYFFTLQSDIVTADEILEDHKVDVLMLSHDYVGHFSSVLAKRAKKKNIPVVIVPALFTEPNKTLSVYKNRPELQVETRFERWVAKRWPQWARALPSGREVLRLEWWRIVVLERLSLAPSKPWVHQMCASDLICLPDESLKQEYIGYGFLPKKLTVVGCFVQDQLFEYRGNKAATAQVNPQLLAALPPDQFTGSNMGFRHESFDAQITELRDILLHAQEYFDVLLSIHPKEKNGRYVILENAGFKFAERPTFELLPNADVYLSYVGSSTNNWAHWARIPCVQWDPFAYVDSGEIKQKSGVIYALNQIDLSSALSKLAQVEARKAMYSPLAPMKAYQKGESYFDRILSTMVHNQLF